MPIYLLARRNGWWSGAAGQFVISALVLFFTTALAVATRPWLGEGYASLIFVVGIMLIGAISGLVRAITTAIIGGAAFNFFVAEPFLQFRFTTWTDFAPPAVFLLCAVFSGMLSGRLRDQTHRALLANARLASLLSASRDLQQVREPGDLREVLRRHLAGSDDLAIGLFWLTDGTMQPCGTVPDDPAWQAAARSLIGPSAQAIDTRALRKEEITDGSTELGALVYQPGVTTTESIAFVVALARLGSLALTRLRLDTEVAETRALAQSEQLKTALLSSVSHDIRTPLTSISTAASSLLAFDGEFDEQTRHDLLVNIVEECGYLDHLTANLLQMSRLQTRPRHLGGNILAAQDMIRRCIARLRSQREEREFVIEAPQDDVLVVADTALFELALINVLQNAVKFSAAGSTITATCSAHGGECIIAITDEGIGVPPDAHARVFERFYRANYRSSVPKGSGLGLAIAKGFVEASGGVIELLSPVRDGHGTTITIRLPRAQLEQCA